MFAAGCTTTNPQTTLGELNQLVQVRLGQSPRPQNATNTLAPLLATNLTAHTAVTIALLNNCSLQATLAAIGISQADLAQAARLPNLEIAGSWRFPNRPPSATDAEYSVAADLLDLLMLPAKKKVAARNLEQSKLKAAQAILQLAAETQSAFYTLQAQQESNEHLNTIVAVNAAQADLAQRQFDAGNINELDLHNQQVPASQAQLDLIKAKLETQKQREQINRLLGLAGEQIHWQITDELPLLPEKELVLENLETLAVAQRLDLALLKNQTDAIAAAWRLKKKTRLIPGVKIGVDTERAPDGQRVTGPTLDLELPIFDQGQPALAKLAAEFKQANDTYQAQLVNVCSEVRIAQAALLAAREMVEFSQTNLLPLRKKILGETLLHYNAMQKNSYDLLAAKEREQMAEQSNIAALRDYWLARVELEHAVGGRLTSTIQEPQKTERKQP